MGGGMLLARLIPRKASAEVELAHLMVKSVWRLPATANQCLCATQEGSPLTKRE